jgi:hypothetical protein
MKSGARLVGVALLTLHQVISQVLSDQRRRFREKTQKRKEVTRRDFTGGTRERPPQKREAGIAVH